MTRLPVLLLVLLLLLPGGVFGAQAGERIVEIRVHGNHTTPNEDVLAISGLSPGGAATPDVLRQAEEKLLGSDRFEHVEVRRRYQSISDPSAILVVIVVDEREGAATGVPLPGPLRRLRLASMWLPILTYGDGYGFTYGVRFSFIDPLGPRTRLSIPLTWGGERRAALEADTSFERGPVTGISGSLAAYRRVNPHFDVPEVRMEAGGRVERRFTPWLRARVEGRVADVEFGGISRTHTAIGPMLSIDTRADPSFPRNAVHAGAGWTHLGFETGDAGRWHGDVRGFVGLTGSNVLALRAQFSRASNSLPPSEQALLGGNGSLRGYRTGYRAGDSMAAISAEVRVPVVSPLSIARAGVKGFIDAGTTWSSAARLADQPFDRGIGAGVYAGVAAFMLNVDVAWAESGKARAHVGLGVAF